MDGGGIRAARNLSAAAVATIAAWSSYYHILHVALRYGERPEVAYGLPFSVDGMLVVATIVMVDDKHCGRPVRPLARLAFSVGVIASVAANIAAAQPSLGARIIDAWPAVALLLVVEMLARAPAARIQPPAEPATAVAATTPGGSIRPELRTAATPQLPAGQARNGTDMTTGSGTSHVPPEPAPHAAGSAQMPPAAHHVLDATGVETGEVPPPGATLSQPTTSSTVVQVDGTVPAPQRDRCPGPSDTAATSAQLAGVPAHVSANNGVAASSRLARDRRPVGSADPAELDGAPEAEVPAGLRPPSRRRPEVAAAPSTSAVAAEVATAGVPAAVGAVAAASIPLRRPGKSRRPTAVTRGLAETIMAAEPQLTRTQVATRLGVSTRRLREVLAG